MPPGPIRVSRGLPSTSSGSGAARCHAGSPRAARARRCALAVAPSRRDESLGLAEVLALPSEHGVDPLARRGLVERTELARLDLLRRRSLRVVVQPAVADRLEHALLAAATELGDRFGPDSLGGHRLAVLKPARGDGDAELGACRPVAAQELAGAAQRHGIALFAALELHLRRARGIVEAQNPDRRKLEQWALENLDQEVLDRRQGPERPEPAPALGEVGPHRQHPLVEKHRVATRGASRLPAIRRRTPCGGRRPSRPMRTGQRPRPPGEREGREACRPPPAQARSLRVPDPREPPR